MGHPSRRIPRGLTDRTRTPKLGEFRWPVSRPSLGGLRHYRDGGAICSRVFDAMAVPPPKGTGAPGPGDIGLRTRSATDSDVGTNVGHSMPRVRGDFAVQLSSLARPTPPLAGPLGWTLSGILVVLLVGLLAFDFFNPPAVTFGSLSVLPVAGSAWLLSRRQVVVVVAAAIIFRLVALLHGDLTVATTVAQIFAVLAVVIGVRLAAISLADRRRSQDRLEAATEVTRAILEGRDSREVLYMIACKARELAGASLAAVATPERDGLVCVGDGIRAEGLQGRFIAVEGAAWPEVLRTDRPLIVGDLSAVNSPFPPVIHVAALGPALILPLSARGHAFGTILVANRKGARAFSGRDLQMVELFAAQAAVAVEYARSQEELQRLAVIADRERIARDLHDGVIQLLFGVGMELQAAGARLDQPELIRTHVAQSLQNLDAAMRDLRGYVHGLRPGVLAGRRLNDALSRVAHEFEASSGVKVVLAIDAQTATELAPIAAQLVQITREALSNVARHAQATTCRLSLMKQNERAVLEIDDNGRGFATAAIGGDGLGLHNIRARVASLGGEVSINSEPAHGTTVRVELPLPQSEKSFGNRGLDGDEGSRPQHSNPRSPVHHEN